MNNRFNPSLHALFLLLIFASSLCAQTVETTTAIPTSATTSSPVDEQLQSAIEPLLASHKGDIGLAIRNLETNEHYEYNADRPMPTASLIKLPLMVATYHAVEDGKLDLKQPIELRDEDKVPGSGILTDHFSAGIKLPLGDYVRLMIRYSDNTATNIVAGKLGLLTTARVMESLGYPETKLHSLVYRGGTSIFPERSKQYGIGSTTAAEMTGLLTKLHRQELASPASTQAMLQHLSMCEDDTKLGREIPATVRFANKTGEIANCRTDAGILYTAGGPVAVCFLSNRNDDQTFADDNKAHLLAGKIGGAIVARFGSAKADNTLRVGAFGKLVEALQRTLNDRLTPSPGLSIDGDFGPATRGAVERLQRERQLPVTGVVSMETWTALGTLIENDAPVPPPEVVNAERLPLQPPPPPDAPPIVTAKAWVIVDDATGDVVGEFNSHTPLEAASTTKVMTAYVVLQHATDHPEVLEETIVFSQRADETPGSTSAIREGERVTVRQLLYGLLLPSGNDASVALAEHFGYRLRSESGKEPSAKQSYEHFITAMNSTAKELGLKHTHYTNPHGLSNSAHVISASDLATLSRSAMQHPLFRKVVATRQFGCTVFGESGYRRNVLWKNTNRLLAIEGYDGIKTGTTSAAGACLVSTSTRGTARRLVVVLGSTSGDARYADTRNLYRWAWEHGTDRVPQPTTPTLQER